MTIELDREAWKHRLIDASGLFATSPETKKFASAVEYSSASLSAIAVNRYTVNTDGTRLRHGYTGYTDSISVGGQAEDGMELSRSNGSTAERAEGLESAAALQKRTLDDLLSFDALRHAPIVGSEDYHGPVRFSGDAAADVFNKLFVPNIEADRPDIGTSARTQGVYQSSFKTPVLPPFLSVVDDPDLRTYDGRGLIGAYKVDDEGVTVAPVDIVEHGKLMNYLIGREPVKDFPASNGHGRAALGQPAHSRAGVILIKTLGNELSPRLLYRVSPDGKRTLVRGAVFDELDQRAIRSGIVAAGGKPYIAQTIGPVPETTIAPEILFADITVKRANEEQQKLPYYAPPALMQ